MFVRVCLTLPFTVYSVITLSRLALFLSTDTYSSVYSVYLYFFLFSPSFTTLSSSLQMRSSTLRFFVSRIKTASFHSVSWPLCPCTEGTAWDFHLWASVFSISWRVIISWAHESVTEEGGGSVWAPEIKGQTSVLSLVSPRVCVFVCASHLNVYICAYLNVFIASLTRCYKRQIKQIKNDSSYLQRHLIVLVFIAEFWTQQMGKKYIWW